MGDGGDVDPPRLGACHLEARRAVAGDGLDHYRPGAPALDDSAGPALQRHVRIAQGRLCLESVDGRLLALPDLRHRDPLRLGILISAGIWTKLTLLPTYVAAMFAMIAARRSRRIVAAAVIPLVAAIVLVTWNRFESGTFSGLVQEVGTRPTTMDDVSKAIRRSSA